MALSRRAGSRFTANIWPGFVDAMTALLLVLMFVLSIFMIIQFVLQETITGKDAEIITKDQELGALSDQLAGLAQALGLEQQRTDRLETELGGVNDALAASEAERAAQATLIATLTRQTEEQAGQIASFEDQVAGLIAQNADLDARNAGLVADLDATRSDLAERESDLSGAVARIADLEALNAREISQKEALQLALAQARAEIDEGVEAARLAAARREALEALVADLESEAADLETRRAALDAELDETKAALTDAEAATLVEAAAAEALRARLENSSAELTAMTLRLEAERKKAEETLELLAASRAAEADLQALRDRELTEAERQAALLAEAQRLLAEERDISTDSARQVELLNQQSAALRTQLQELQGLLDASEAAEAAAQVQIQSLGSNLNAALARVASEERKRAELEARERARLEEEAKDLRKFRSEFFARLSEILGTREGVQIVGDRFVFSSEVLFAPGSDELGLAGRRQVSQVAGLLRDVAAEIPDGINWILRVDGHTDKTPLGRGSPFEDNWELSQARALSVVRYLIENEGIPANRLAATGFGEFQPIDPGDSPAALARNRRIELKFTEK
ncbi:peptidoglycan -binding protein [Oceanomicrobium pacificus]|uniref:Peptidoglycan-binding protein n=1 Tax=Oceanomicrobium pacificus TaxID=2692916 RepID=A0A6B0TSE5_9RHOB|nr:peptidoglycan -binding protein [Oceanomicrobium pacificus]MXU64254.1 peptidoglycan -binding protein [Oceanomicrobium pacificus]